MGSARETLRGLPAEVRREIGFDLRLVQLGHAPRDWKPIPAVGIGANEIRLRVNGAYRVVYVAKYSEGIYVLHVFQKKTRRTSRLDISLARARYALAARNRLHS